jgi:diguanylate cyclase (GGDEF)-like protein
MTISVSDILAAIDAGTDIPTLAPVMRRLLALRGDSTVEVAQLHDVVRTDPALTLRMLRAANASGEHELPADDLDTAFERLGSHNVRHLALTAPFIDDSTNSISKADDHLRYQWLWERSICAAVASDIYAHKLNAESADQYHTAGLLLDIGIFFLLHSFPEIYTPILDHWRTEGGALEALENDQLGVTHGVVGQQLARKWNLGSVTEDAIRLHSGALEAEASKQASIFQMANLSVAILYEDRNAMGLERAVAFAEKRFQITRPHFIDELQRITLISDLAAAKIAIESGPIVPYTTLLQGINAELGKAALSYEQMVRELQIAMHKAENLAKRLEETNKKLREAANYDPLTHIHNRRFFEEFLNWNFNRSKRYNSTLGCLMLDIDHFKNINDTYGHLAGDHVLQGVADTLQRNLRNTDIEARYGGEEFIVLLPESNSEAVAFTADKLNQAVKNVTYPIGDEPIRITISVGYITYAPEEMPLVEKPADLVKLADQNMYLAKQNGRDRIWPTPVTPVK